jgi:hypothetical protein
MVDTQVPADADQPGLEICAAIERVQRFENFQKNVLRQILGFVVAADELVSKIEHLAPVLTDDLFPRRLVSLQAAGNQLVDVWRGRGGWLVGHPKA